MQMYNRDHLHGASNLDATKTSFNPSWRHSELQYNFAANATTSISNFQALTREAKLLMQPTLITYTSLVAARPQTGQGQLTAVYASPFCKSKGAGLCFLRSVIALHMLERTGPRHKST